MCSNWHKRDGVQVDHIEECGQLRKYDDLPGFVSRLFCETSGLQVLCKDCHGKIKHKKPEKSAD